MSDTLHMTVIQNMYAVFNSVGMLVLTIILVCTIFLTFWSRIRARQAERSRVARERELYRLRNM
jgi:cbb3-type cytochrome oxidase subunit 3